MAGKKDAPNDLKAEDDGKNGVEDSEDDDEYIEEVDEETEADAVGVEEEAPSGDEDTEAEDDDEVEEIEAGEQTQSDAAGEDAEGEDDDDDFEVKDKDNETAPRGLKRTQPATSQAGSNKKQKHQNGETHKASSSKVDGSKPNTAAAEGKVGSKHDDPKDSSHQGSKARLPKEGQQVQWKALPGYVDGEVVEILTKSKEVNGKQVKASEADPRIVLKSNKSGKICVHKPGAVYFE
ncbi:hypothetical protein F4778DRAFT_310577 [Xylariomycetidae sp. FL2044]|nr:hypothetical protein F4778DRAFT_310577 [Xylariomycetidae sp. FL2044]